VLHENVVSIHRVAEANGLPFLVMPYIPGDSLVKRLDQRGALELREILRIGMQVAAGLAAAHAQGLVHRDIKPGNILLDSGVERVTITDFGLARAADDASLTRSGVITGTPQFMSPEQARGEPVDARSDLFSLGSVIYAMCTGRAPFRAETAYGVLRRICEADARPIRELAPDVPAWLTEIVQKLHAKDRVDRFQSAGEVAELLGRWLSHLEQPATIPAPARLERRASKMLQPGLAKRLWPIVTAAAVCLVAIFISMRYRDQSLEQTSTAAPAPGVESSAVVESQPTSEPLVDDQTMYEDYRELNETISRFQREWSTSPPAENSWESEIPEIRRQLEELSKRIDQSGL
jgi:serine/threonine protein kinase